MITQILLTQTFIMFILMILGLILSKTGLLTEHGSKDMANILLYAVIPCVIIRSYITDFTMEKLYGLLMSAVLAVAAFAVAIAVSYIIYGMRKPIDNFGTAFCNAGFIGIPLVTAVFGNEAAFYVASFASILNLLQWTYGIVIITRRKDMINIKKVFHVDISPPPEEMPETDIIIFFQQVDIAETGTPALPGGIRNTVARPDGHTDRIREPNVMIHKAVQHSDGEDGTHPSSFKHQTCATVYIHICLP